MASNYDYGNFELIVNQKEIDERFLCSVCRSLFENPYKVDVCGHVFCQSCLFNSFAQTKKCPMCRASFDFKKTKPEVKISKDLNTLKHICNVCESKVTLRDLNSHRLTCSDDSNKSIPTQNMNRNEFKNRYTFSCPFCTEKNFDLDNLTKHCNGLHSNENQSKVCPVCKAMPWGNENQISSNFMLHLNVRHKFEYDHYVDFNMDEEISLKSVLQKSNYQI
jgi:hypothetical protein